MTLHDKLVNCEKYIKEKGYQDASIVKGGDSSEMIVFKIPNITAKYPNEKPNISVAFANGTMNNGEIDFDVMQVLCFVSSGIPSDRLIDIQKFCADFNKTMQVGHFGVDFKHESVYFKCAQVVEKNAGVDYLLQLFDSVLTMILFYFGYVYEILIELSYGIIGYGGTSHRLRERRRVMNEAMAELKGEGRQPEPSNEFSARNQVVEELFEKLRTENPNILAEARIDTASLRGYAERKTKRQVSAEETAIKIMDLASAQLNGSPVKRFSENSARKFGESPVKQFNESPAKQLNESPAKKLNDSPVKRRKTQVNNIPDELPAEVSVDLKKREPVSVSEKDAGSLKNQMPSITMYAQRENRTPEPPLDLEELKRALLIEQEERERMKRERMMGEGSLEEEVQQEAEIWLNEQDDKETIDEADNNENKSEADNEKSSESLLQRLRNWTQS